MTSITHSRNTLRLATLVGFIAGLIPDIDFFIQSADDPLLQLEYHRHFTHALIFAPLGGVLVAALLWLLPFIRNRLRFWQLCLFTTLGFLSSGLLDACTSYGTYLLWPFTESRIAWNIIAIIDPLFTLILLNGVLIAWYRHSIFVTRLTVCLALAYLAIATYQHQRAEMQAQALAERRGHVIEASVVKPTLGNIILWRSVYRAGDNYYVDAVRVGLKNKIFPGEAIPAFRLERDFPGLVQNSSSQMYLDIQRFARFSDGFLVRHLGYPNVIGDIRYAMLPNGVEPLWGITIDQAQPDTHVPFEHYRQFTEADRQQFLSMLFGR